MTIVFGLLLEMAATFSATLGKHMMRMSKFAELEAEERDERERAEQELANTDCGEEDSSTSDDGPRTQEEHQDVGGLTGDELFPSRDERRHAASMPLSSTTSSCRGAGERSSLCSGTGGLLSGRSSAREHLGGRQSGRPSGRPSAGPRPSRVEEAFESAGTGGAGRRSDRTQSLSGGQHSGGGGAPGDLLPRSATNGGKGDRRARTEERARPRSYAVTK